MQESISDSKVIPLSGHQLPYISLGNSVIASSQNTQTFNQTPRLSSSEYNTSWTNPKIDIVPYINTNYSDKVIHETLEDLKQRYDDMSLAIINMECKIQQMEAKLNETKPKKQPKSKSCPICLESLSSKSAVKIAYFDCGHWICADCLLIASHQEHQFIKPLSLEEKQALSVQLLVNEFQDRRVIVCPGEKLNLKLGDQVYVLYFESQINLYRDQKNKLIYTCKPRLIDSVQLEIETDSKPPLYGLFNQSEDFYSLQCPLCKVKSCHFKREDCYKIVYF